MTDDCGDFDPDDYDYAEIPNDDFLFGAYSPLPPPSALQQGLLFGPTLETGPYQRGDGRLPTIRLYDAEGRELVWQSINWSPEQLRVGEAMTLTFTLRLN